MKKILSLIVFLSFALSVQAQFTKQDTLRGSITPERAWWDLRQYNLSVEVFPEKQSIQGVNTITYTVLESKEVMQIDLQMPMKIEKVTQKGKELSFTSEGSAHFIKLKEKQKKGTTNTLTVQFSGTPKVARNPPWDGGFTWRKDSQGNHFIANSNQGIGSSIWWPNKDHPADEPDKGVNLEITAPSNVVAVGNGRLINSEEMGGKKTWTWKVVNPINNYAINVNIGDYVHFSEKYKGEKGELDMDYWVLRENEAKAKAQFKQAPMMMRLLSIGLAHTLFMKTVLSL